MSSPSSRRSTFDGMKKKRPRTTTTTTNANGSSNSSIPPCRRKAIIVGAGMSGIACARELVERGWDVLVVEGRGRVGGRLWGISLYNNNNNLDDNTTTTTTKMDAGGALIHGTKGNPLTTLCQELSSSSSSFVVQTTSDLNDTLLLDDAGWPLDSKVDQTTTQQFNQVLEHAFESIKQQQQQQKKNTVVPTTTSRKRRHEESSSSTTTTISHHHERIEQQQQPQQQHSKKTRTKTNGGPKNGHYDGAERITSTAATDLKRPPDPTNSVGDGTNANEKHHHQDASQSSNGIQKNGSTNHGQHHHYSGSNDHNDDKSFLSAKKTVHNDDHDHNDENNNNNNFGHLCDKIRQEKNIPLSGAYLWHQLSLELSCGAPLDQLGYRWNEDEAYGFEGAHVALQGGTTTWQHVVEELAKPLNVLLHSKVVEIRVIRAGEEVVREDNDDHDDDDDHHATTTSPKRQSKRLARQRVGTTSVASYNEEQLAGETTAATTTTTTSPRRVSSRTNKGVPEMRWEGGAVEEALYAYKRNVVVESNNGSTGSSKYRPTTRPRVWVALESGVILEADAVVCTLPLGVLQSNTVEFVPPLPSQQHTQLGCGLLNKCILTFEKVFWQNVDFLGLCDPEEPYIVLNGHVLTGEPILVVMLAGTQAQDVEQMSDQDVLEDVLEAITRICQLPPGTILTPLDYYLTRWGQDPFSKMSYSYVPPNVPGQDAYQQGMEPVMVSSTTTTTSSKKSSNSGSSGGGGSLSSTTTRQANNNKATTTTSKKNHHHHLPVLCFAGEHTTPYHPSTIHGAYLSGIREAYRLDLSYEPKSNNGLLFDSTQIYERTFHVHNHQDNNNNNNRNDGKQIATTTNGNTSSKVAAAASLTFKTNGNTTTTTTTITDDDGSKNGKQSLSSSSSSSTTTTTTTSSLRGRHRRRRTSGHMQLRSRTTTTTMRNNGTTSENSLLQHSSDAAATAVVIVPKKTTKDQQQQSLTSPPSRRSRRTLKKSRFAAHHHNNGNNDNNHMMKKRKQKIHDPMAPDVELMSELSPEQQHQLEERILQRAVDTFEDWKSIESIMLPLWHGPDGNSNDNKKKKETRKEDKKQQQQSRMRVWKQSYRKFRGRAAAAAKKKMMGNESLTQGWLAPLQLDGGKKKKHL